jgi:simple sugar transport system permease protein
MNILDLVLDLGFLAAAVRMAVPLLLGTLGELIAERSGVINLGIEGMMLAAALAGFTAATFTGSLWLGVLASVAVGALAGLVMAVLVVSLRLDQTVAGIGVTMSLTGLSLFAYRLMFGQGATPPSITPFSTVPIPGLADIPVIGPVFFNQFALTYIAYALVPALAWFLQNTPGGLALRTVGENPLAAAGAGVDVMRVRTIALIAAGAHAGLAGAYLNLAALGSFTFGIVSGRGWICLALVVLGRWKPIPCAFAALLFGAVDAFQLRMQISGSTTIPYQIFLALPYVATVVAMALSARSAVAPAALMKPYDPEAR